MRILAGAVELCGGVARGTAGQWLALGLCLLASTASALEIELQSEQVKREAPAKANAIEKSDPRERILEKSPVEPDPGLDSSAVQAASVAGQPPTRPKGPQASRRGADDSLPVHTQSLATSLPAVDGLNAQASAFAGAASEQALFGGEGSISMPLGLRYGLQIDGAIADFDSEFQGNVTVVATAAHLFWRDPARGLIGLYGNYLHADAFSGIDVYAGAAEGALYFSRFTLEGVVGVEGGEVDGGTFGNAADIGVRIFDVAQLAYYPTDNLRLSVGHSYVLGANAALFRAEWGFGRDARTMMAPYISGTVLEGGDAAVLGGLRVYFGQHDKTLIRRHREDDPPVLGDSISNLISQVNSMLDD